VADGEPMSNNSGMEKAFEAVVFGTVGISVVMSLYFLFSRDSTGDTHEQIGAGGFVSDGGVGIAPAPAPIESRAERELEVRQMLTARSERLVRAGEPPLDIDAEVARLLGPAQSDGLAPGVTDEVRQLVVARNERRVRQGLEPLEVEAEVVRTLEELER
jgi:hypothetical protein